MYKKSQQKLGGRAIEVEGIGGVTGRGGVSRIAAGAARIVPVAGLVGEGGGEGLGASESEVDHGGGASAVERRGLLLDGEFQVLQFGRDSGEFFAQAALLAAPVGDQARGPGRFGGAEQVVLLAVAEVAEVGGELAQQAVDLLSAVLQAVQTLDVGGQQLGLDLERRDADDLGLAGGQFSAGFSQLATLLVHGALAAQVQASGEHQAECQEADHDVIEHDWVPIPSRPLLAE